MYTALAASIRIRLRRTTLWTAASQSIPSTFSKRNTAEALANARHGAPSVTARTPKYVRYAAANTAISRPAAGRCRLPRIMRAGGVSISTP